MYFLIAQEDIGRRAEEKALLSVGLGQAKVLWGGGGILNKEAVSPEHWHWHSSKDHALALSIERVWEKWIFST